MLRLQRAAARAGFWGCCGDHPGGLESLWVRKEQTQLLAAQLFAAFDVSGELHKEVCALCTVAVMFLPSLLFCRFQGGEPLKVAFLPSEDAL